MTDYEAISAAYRAALPPGRMAQLPLGTIDRLGVPFWTLTFYQEDGPVGAGGGYGTSDSEALMGAFGELTEVVSCHMALRHLPRVHGSFRQLVAQRGPNGIVDPRALCLEAGSDYTPDRPLQWVEVRRYPSGEAVLVPIEFVASTPPDLEPGPWLITLITNGLGAGLSYDGAVSHGLLELLQRDGNGVRFRALADDLAVELDDVRDPQTRALLAHLEAQGVEVVVKLAATDFGVVNLYVVGADREQRPDTIPIMAMACGEAAHPDRERALRKALLEFAAARSRMAFSHGPLEPVQRVTPPAYLDQYLERYDPDCEEPRALAAMRALYPRSLAELRELLAPRVLQVRRRVPFSSLPTLADGATPSREQLAGLVSERLRAAGLDVLVADYSQLGSAVRAVKVLVPGLEVETMSYHRIGERNLCRLIEQDEGLAGVGPAPAGAARVLLTPEAEERVGGPAWLDVAAVDRVVGPLYAIYREPGRHAAALFAKGLVQAGKRA